MAVKTHFVCSSCGYESSKWYGKCPDCGIWNSMTEVAFKESSKKSHVFDLATSIEPQNIGKVKSTNLTRLKTGFTEFDRVLGGGVVAGSVILLSGDPGIGKSTLLLELARNIARANSKVLYVSGEESESQIKIRAERIGIDNKSQLFVFSNSDIDQVIKAAEKVRPDLLIIDSIQTMASVEFPGFAGSLPQIRHATARIVSFAKRNNVPAFIVGHVTKEGTVAGPQLLAHMVDCVLYLEGESPPASAAGTKILRSFKNRFGDTMEVGLFSMEEQGLVEISNVTNFFIEESKKAVPGSCLTVVMEGSRPLIVEIQALTVLSNLSYPRRVSLGISDRRLELLLAVIQKHLKVSLDRMDVFVNVVGGLKITETASDLAVCLAILSSYKNKPLNGTVALSEVGLLGELKSVINEKARIQEAKKLGFKNIITQEKYGHLGDIIKNI